MSSDLATKIIGVLLALVLALLARETRRMLNEVGKVLRRQKIQRDEMRQFINTVFTLFAKLYPEKSDVIAKEMRSFMLTNRGDDEDQVTVSPWREQGAD